VKKEKDGRFERNAYGQPAYPDFPGYDPEYYRQVAKDAATSSRSPKPFMINNNNDG
jgi:hypothetical protein